MLQPHEKGFRKKLSRYISFEKELGGKEERHMIGLGESIYEEGIEQGIELKLFLLVCKKLAKGKSMTEIADALEEPEDEIRTLCEKAALYAPEYDEGKIRDDWRRTHP